MAGWTLGALVALTCATAGAQVVQVNSATTFGPGDCGARTPVTVSYGFTTPLNISLTSTPTVQLFLTTDACPSNIADGDTQVTEPDGSIELVAPGTAADTTGTMANASTTAADLAQDDCSAEQELTWNVCFYEFYSVESGLIGSITRTGTAAPVVTVDYDSQPPAPPVITAVTSGDEHLRVRFAAASGDDATYFDVLAAPVGDTSGSATGSSDTGDGSGTTCPSNATLISDQEDSLSRVVPDNNAGVLINGTAYDVWVRAYDDAHNASRCSKPVVGTPELIDDFWRLYKKDGGADGGGCTQGGPGLALLGIFSAAILLGRKRRKGNTP